MHYFLEYSPILFCRNKDDFSTKKARIKFDIYLISLLNFVPSLNFHRIIGRLYLGLLKLLGGGNLSSSGSFAELAFGF